MSGVLLPDGWSSYGENALMNTFSLGCKCGTTEAGLTNETAYQKGWRLHGRSPLCPRCAQEHDQKARRAAVKKYGEEAVARAEEIMEQGEKTLWGQRTR